MKYIKLYEDYTDFKKQEINEIISKIKKDILYKSAIYNEIKRVIKF